MTAWVSQARAQYLQPLPESADIAHSIADVITRRFGYTWLDSDIGASPIPDIEVGTLSPGKATLADALFEDDRRW